MSTARAARFAAWEAERATWRLANRGDTRYALERRVFRKQLRDMRRSLKELLTEQQYFSFQLRIRNSFCPLCQARHRS